MLGDSTTNGVTVAHSLDVECWVFGMLMFKPVFDGG
jgi:hypothetical protein